MADLFPLFRSKHLKPVWEFSADVLIWRILFTSQNTIVGEIRDQEKKSTGYFCVDAHSGKPLWKDKEYDEPWWIGIETVYDKWMILHGFARPDMPEHRGIWMVDIETGNLLWKNESVSYWFIHDQKLYAHKYIFEKRIGYEIDITTGIVLNEYSDNLDVFHELRRTALQNYCESQTGVAFPELFSQGQVDLAVEASIQQITGGNALEGWIEYLVRNNILIMSYYQQEQSAEQKSLKNILAVYDIDRRVTLFNNTIAEHAQVPSPDTFFVKDEFVYYIKNKNMLTALRPWKS